MYIENEIEKKNTFTNLVSLISYNILRRSMEILSYILFKKTLTIILTIEFSLSLYSWDFHYFYYFPSEPIWTYCIELQYITLVTQYCTYTTSFDSFANARHMCFSINFFSSHYFCGGWCNNLPSQFSYTIFHGSAHFCG